MYLVGIGQDTRLRPARTRGTSAAPLGGFVGAAQPCRLVQQRLRATVSRRHVGAPVPYRLEPPDLLVELDALADIVDQVASRGLGAQA
jgi:hypothetical protein